MKLQKKQIQSLKQVSDIKINYEEKTRYIETAIEEDIRYFDLIGENFDNDFQKVKANVIKIEKKITLR